MHRRSKAFVLDSSKKSYSICLSFSIHFAKLLNLVVVVNGEYSVDDSGNVELSGSIGGGIAVGFSFLKASLYVQGGASLSFAPYKSDAKPLDTIAYGLKTLWNVIFKKKQESDESFSLANEILTLREEHFGEIVKTFNEDIEDEDQYCDVSETTTLLRKRSAAKSSGILVKIKTWFKKIFNTGGSKVDDVKMLEDVLAYAAEEKDADEEVIPKETAPIEHDISLGRQLTAEDLLAMVSHTDPHDSVDKVHVHDTEHHSHTGLYSAYFVVFNKYKEDPEMVLYKWTDEEKALREYIFASLRLARKFGALLGATSAKTFAAYTVDEKSDTDYVKEWSAAMVTAFEAVFKPEMGEKVEEKYTASCLSVESCNAAEYMVQHVFYTIASKGLLLGDWKDGEDDAANIKLSMMHIFPDLCPQSHGDFMTFDRVKTQKVIKDIWLKAYDKEKEKVWVNECAEYSISVVSDKNKQCERWFHIQFLEHLDYYHELANVYAAQDDGLLKAWLNSVDVDQIDDTKECMKDCSCGVQEASIIGKWGFNTGDVAIKCDGGGLIRLEATKKYTYKRNGCTWTAATEGTKALQVALGVAQFTITDNKEAELQLEFEVDSDMYDFVAVEENRDQFIVFLGALMDKTIEFVKEEKKAFDNAAEEEGVELGKWHMKNFKAWVIAMKTETLKYAEELVEAVGQLLLKKLLSAVFDYLVGKLTDLAISAITAAIPKISISTSKVVGFTITGKKSGEDLAWGAKVYGTSAVDLGVDNIPVYPGVEIGMSAQYTEGFESEYKWTD